MGSKDQLQYKNKTCYMMQCNERTLPCYKCLVAKLSMTRLPNVALSYRPHDILLKRRVAQTSVDHYERL